MIDHLSLGVRSLDRARRFYDALLGPLGHAVSRVSEAELAYGPGGETGIFYLYPVTKGRVAGLGAHIAFGADSRAAVDEAYQAAMREGAVSVRPAGPHPDLSPDYYGTVLFDPDGNKLEIVLAADGR
jgi:catechol 2,3-dioxygenase-like lactoylglutathione lyase family enzyme